MPTTEAQRKASKKWDEKNKEYIRQHRNEYMRQYMKANYEDKVADQQKAYKKNRYENDAEFRENAIASNNKKYYYKKEWALFRNILIDL